MHVEICKHAEESGDPVVSMLREAQKRLDMGDTQGVGVALHGARLAVSWRILQSGPRPSGPTGNPVADAYIAGAMHAIGRQPWDDMHDFYALQGLDYAKEKL